MDIGDIKGGVYGVMGPIQNDFHSWVKIVMESTVYEHYRKW